MSPAIDIYSFGMCALEMAALEIQGNGDSGNLVTDENINRTIESLEEVQQKDFIRKCLDKNYQKRPSARELLFHPLLFEVHSLKLLAAHCLVKSAGKLINIHTEYTNSSTNTIFVLAANISETITDELMQKLYGPDVVVAEVLHQHGSGRQVRMCDVPVAEKLEKFVEDVK